MIWCFLVCECKCAFDKCLSNVSWMIILGSKAKEIYTKIIRWSVRLSVFFAQQNARFLFHIWLFVFVCFVCFPVCKQTNNMVAQKKWNKYRYDARCSITKPDTEKKPNIESNKQTNKQITQKQKEKMLHLKKTNSDDVPVCLSLCITFQLIIFFFAFCFFCLFNK